MPIHPQPIKSRETVAHRATERDTSMRTRGKEGATRTMCIHVHTMRLIAS